MQFLYTRQFYYVLAARIRVALIAGPLARTHSPATHLPLRFRIGGVNREPNKKVNEVRQCVCVSIDNWLLIANENILSSRRA